MNFKDCDGVYTCVDGSFDCENCTLVAGGGTKQPKVPRKQKQTHAPQKQFKRRKK